MYLYKLDELLSLHRCGGKVANLARALEAGFDVPDALALESDALTRFLDASDLAGTVQAYLDGAVEADAQALEQAWRDLCGEVDRAPFPDDLGRELETVVHDFLAADSAPVVVRSSALVEDSSEASYAGVFESVLDVADLDAMRRAIKVVWCSLWSPHALRYMEKMAREPTVGGMAVLIQRQVPAESSGLLYTADPDSGDPFRLKIYGVRGLSVDLMSGTGDSESCTVDWESGKIVDREGPDADGVLTDQLVERLVAMALSLDDLLNSRLDIEWAFVDERVRLVQARPLTALPEYFPVDLSEEEAAKHWELPNFIVPLRKDCAINLVTPLYDHFDAMEMWYRHHPRDGIHFAGINWTGADFNGHRYALLEPDRTFIHSFQEDWSRLEPWLDANEPHYRSRWDNHVAEVRGIATDARNAIESTTAAQELIPVWIDVATRLMDLISFGWSAPQAMGWMHEALLSYLLHQVSVDYELAPLMAGSDTSMTFLFSRDLQALVRGIASDEVLRLIADLPVDKLKRGLRGHPDGVRFLEDLDELFWAYGKSPLAWRGRPPFWTTNIGGDAITSFQTIKQTVTGRQRDVSEMQRKALSERREYQAEIKRQIAERDRELAARFDRIVDRARVWTQALNDRHFCTTAWNWEAELVWVIGSRLTEAGLLDRPIDQLALRLEDLEAISGLADVAEYRELAEARVATYNRYRRYTPPPSLGTKPEGESVAAESSTDASADGTLFEGRGMAGQRTTGRARRVKDLFDPHLLDSLDEEQILVLPEEHAFFYADWHSIFTIVRGVVSPGRPSHHLTQVARECGMPVIGYVKGDLGTVRDGDLLELDPQAGTVRVLDGRAHPEQVLIRPGVGR